MEFVNLSHRILTVLKSKGFTTLHSTSSFNEGNPTWIPYREEVDKLMELDNLFIAKISVPLNEKQFLIIDDALKNIQDVDLIGQVLISDLM